MKKTYKFVIIAIFFLVLNIFQANYKVYSYTEEEVKDIINFTVVDSTLSEDEYDVKIDASDLIESIKFPVIQASIESVLYDSNNLTDINFLTVSTTNTNSSWLVIQETVAKFFRISLYIAAIAMITVLIYMAIILIIESYNPPQMPHGSRMFRNIDGGRPEKEIRKKAIFEQWLVSVILIALIAAIINLVVNFTDVFANIVAGYNISESSFTVYVVETGSSGEGYTFETTLEGLIMFESEYDWSNYAAKNVLFIIGGIIITVFKYFVYFLFVVRMFVIAFLVAAAPIIILINAYLQIGRKKGIFRTWLAIFLFCALLKPVISLVYYVMMANNIILKMPLYILVVVIVEIIAILLSIMVFISSLRKVKDIEQQEYDEIHGKAEAKSSRARMYQPQRGGGITYEDIVRELRHIANNRGGVGVMIGCLNNGQQQIGESNKQIFVNNLKNCRIGLSKGQNPDDLIINEIKGSGTEWGDKFNEAFK